MSELNTISDSKEVFYKEFPYVIPHVFRRVADEILVELNLLSHQKNFQTNFLFCLGLRKAFSDLTLGYRPEKHINKLFEALCISNNIDPKNISNQAKNATQRIDSLSTSELNDFINTKSFKNIEIQKIFSNVSFNRLTVIGIYDLVSRVISKDDSIEDSEIKELSTKVSTAIGFSAEKTERNIHNYINNVEKLKQSLELIRLMNSNK